MSEVKKIATRESYGNALVELGKKYDDVVVLDADLASATKTGIFKKAFPERHIDCGIAEGNMMGVAAGIATTLHFTYPIFVTLFMLLLFREKASWITLLAIGLAVGGVARLSIDGGEMRLDKIGVFIV